jgi:phosphate transport system permease protein
MRGKILEEKIMKLLMIAATAAIIATLVIILAMITIKGLPAMNLAMITQPPKGGFYLGKEGGVLNAILGSFYMVGAATVLALAVSLPVVLYLNVYMKKDSGFAALVRFSFDVLWGIPSIVYGAFGFTILIFLGLGTSLLGGIITMAILIFPIMCRAMDEVVRTVPRELVEASECLGATKMESAFSVIVRQVFPGIMTAVLVAMGRGIGDAASILFTAGFSDSIPRSLLRPVATLPLAIFFQLNTPIVEVQQRAYASALILTILILIISILSRFLSAKLARHSIK